MFAIPTLTISDSNFQTRERLPVADLQKSFKETWNKNDMWTITFSIMEQRKYAKAIELISSENIVTYNGQEFVIKQSNREISNGVSTYTVTATHRYFNDANNIRKNDQYSGSKTWSFQDAVNFYCSDNNQGITTEFHGSFPTVQIENLGNGSFLKFGQDYFNSFNAVIVPNNKRWVFYSYDEFKKKNGKKIIYQHDSENLKINMDSTSIVNECRCLGKPIENSNPQKYSVDFIWKNQNSINNWGIHCGDVISDERFTDQKSMSDYEDKHQQTEPNVTLEISSFNRKDFEMGEEILLMIPSLRWSTKVVLNHYERNPFLEYDVPVLQFDNTNLSLRDVNVALHDQIENIRNSTSLMEIQGNYSNDTTTIDLIGKYSGKLTLNLSSNIVYASFNVASLIANTTLVTVEAPFIPKEKRQGTFYASSDQIYIVTYIVDTIGNISINGISTLNGQIINEISDENNSITCSFNYLI